MQKVLTYGFKGAILIAREAAGLVRFPKKGVHDYEPQQPLWHDDVHVQFASAACACFLMRKSGRVRKKHSGVSKQFDTPLFFWLPTDKEEICHGTWSGVQTARCTNVTAG